MECQIDLDRYQSCLADCHAIEGSGTVSDVVGLVVEALCPMSRIGSVCDIYPQNGMGKLTAEVVGFRENKLLLMPLQEIRGIGPGCRVVTRNEKAATPVGPGLLGRVIDGLGHPIDGKGGILSEQTYPIYAEPVNPLQRRRINRPLDIGVRAINGLLTVGCGQRVGIFSGSGVGKSVLLGMMARNTAADVNVIALIGERGREVNEFIEKELGK